MKIAEALKQIHELQHLKGTKLPGLNNVINDIIPAPNDSRFEVFFNDYLYTHDIYETIKLHQVGNFEILLVIIIDPKVAYGHAWYNDYFTSTEA
jgi:hypothetical protein